MIKVYLSHALQISGKRQKGVRYFQGQPAVTAGKGSILGRVRGQAWRSGTPSNGCQQPLLVPVHAVGCPIASGIRGRIAGVDDQKNARLRVSPMLWFPRPECHFTAGGKKNAMIVTSNKMF